MQGMAEHAEDAETPDMLRMLSIGPFAHWLIGSWAQWPIGPLAHRPIGVFGGAEDAGDGR